MQNNNTLLCKKIKKNTKSQNELFSLNFLNYKMTKLKPSQTLVPNLKFIFESDHHFYMLLEKYDSDLFTLISNPHITFSIKMVLNTMDQLLTKLLTIHTCGIGHQDIKPENILVNYNNSFPKMTNKNDQYTKLSSEFVYTDFDSSCILMKYSNQGEFGTKIYRCPYYDKNNYDVEKADIYSLGKTFILLLTNGRYNVSKFISPNESKIILECYLSQVYPELHVCQNDLIELIIGMTNPNPKKRYKLTEIISIIRICHEKI